MKVLTDWRKGPPPREGWWLVKDEISDLPFGFFHYYTKSGFWPDGYYWCGLAFNPDTVIMAKLFCDDNVVRVLPVIQEFTL